MIIKAIEGFQLRILSKTWKLACQQPTSQITFEKQNTAVVCVVIVRPAECMVCVEDIHIYLLKTCGTLTCELVATAKETIQLLALY